MMFELRTGIEEADVAENQQVATFKYELDLFQYRPQVIVEHKVQKHSYKFFRHEALLKCTF